MTVLTHAWYRHLTRIIHHFHVESHRFFAERGLITLSLPLTTGAISSPVGLGSDSQPVEIEMFGVRTYLADSMQFMLEYGCRIHAGGAYYVMPSFRGDPSDAFHLAQFTHAECEILGGLDDIVELAEQYVRALSRALLCECGADIETLAGTTSHVEAVDGTFPRVCYEDAVAALRENPGWLKELNGFLLPSREGERELTRRFGRAGQAVWLTHMPARSVPFYQARTPDRSVALVADLLMGHEVVGAGQRHQRRADAESSLIELGNPMDPYRWYLEMRDRLPMQTAGMGLGMERYLMWLLRCEDIRDLVLVARENGHVSIP